MEEDGGGWSAPGSRAVAAASKKKSKKEKNDGDNTLQLQPRYPVPFSQIPGIADALLERLAALGATEPSFMIGKSLVMSDVNHEQARLFFSCKRKSLPQVTGVFTQTEMRFVQDKTLNTGDLLVTAFDRAGRIYDLTCKYLTSNAGYRFITEWNTYVNGNGLGVDTCVELWWFRSRKLYNRHEMRPVEEGKEGKKKVVPVVVESGHPDGSLGLVLLHYGKQQAAATAEAPGVQDTETTEEDKLADGGGECDEPTIRKRNTKVSREEVFNAAIGLLRLMQDNGGGGRDGDRDEDEENRKVEKQNPTTSTSFLGNER